MFLLWKMNDVFRLCVGNSTRLLFVVSMNKGTLPAVLEHTRCEDTDGGGNPFDCSGEATHKVLKALVNCAGTGCNATTCCGKCWIDRFCVVEE